MMAAHEHQFLGEAGEIRVEPDGERDVGHRAAFEDRDLMRIFVDLLDHEIGGPLGRGLRAGLAFVEGRDLVRSMNGWVAGLRVVPGASKAAGHRPSPIDPCAPWN